MKWDKGGEVFFLFLIGYNQANTREGDVCARQLSSNKKRGGEVLVVTGALYPTWGYLDTQCKFRNASVARIRT